MSAHNYLDDLDNLLDDPKSNLTSAPLPSSKPKVADTQTAQVEQTIATFNTSDEAQQASHTWAEVIEAASRALHESTQLSQEATRKNIELAKEQQESIKELSDAASGWRHATRQAVQEVNATKKNIIILTVISGLIAVAGFGTTIGVMLQSRAGFVSMSNAILENVDEHQTIVSKTLTLKMDELASTIEQMQASIDQVNAHKANTSPTAAVPIASDAPETAINAEAIQQAITVEATSTKDAEPSSQVSAVQITSPLLTPTPAPAPSPILAPINNLVTTQPANVAATFSNPSAESWQQLLTQVDQLQQQLQQIEQNSLKQTQEQSKQWQQLALQVDEKLAQRLAKLPTATGDAPKSPTSAAAVVDTKPIMEQLTRLRQDMAELRLLQQSLKEQMGQVKQTVTESANKPYQYRLPQEGERYPR